MANDQTRITAEKLLDVVRSLVAEVRPGYDREKVSLESSFDRDIGLDSLTRVELVARVEAAFGITLPESTFAEADSGGELLRMIATVRPDIGVAIPAVPPAKPRKATTEFPDDVATLVELLRWHAERHGDRTHIQLYQDDGRGETLSYAALKEGAENVAAALQELGLDKAEPIVIMLPTGIDYFLTFFGILMAGGIPVPIYPPARPSQIEEHMRRHSRIVENCRARILVTVAEGKRAAQLLMSLSPGLRQIVTAAELQRPAAKRLLPAIKAEDTAFLQYTSGSTGNPKGVILTHANLLANIRAMGKAVEADSEDVFVSWLPLYHDMGLIGAWLGSLYYAALFVVMSPLTFLARPERWLRAIERHSGTLTASPNFGYEYTLHRLEKSDLTGLDLSSLRGAYNGAEAVSPKTVRAFSERFGPYGFGSKVLNPVYGLAECSVGLAFPPLQRGAIVERIERDTFMHSHLAVPTASKEVPALHFVSSGRPLEGHSIRIVDKAGNELPERREGRLEFRGPSTTSGYYRDAEKTAQLFDGEWLDSGDLAYIADGELFITGRIKDVIIRAGRNIYPDELEKAIGDIPGIRKGCVAIFGSHDPKSATEQLVVLAETRSKKRAERHELQQRVNALASELIGTPPDRVVLAPPGSVLKTSSGKIRRSASRQRYEKGEIGKKSRAIVWQVGALLLSSISVELRRMAERFKALLFAIYSWSLVVAVIPVAWVGAVALPDHRRRWEFMGVCARLVARMTATPVEIVGKENIPSGEGPYVIVLNHASYLDSFVIAATLPLPFHSVVKAEFSKRFLTRFPLQRLNAEFVERFDTGKSVEDAAHLAEALKAGSPLLFFAESTFTRAPGLQPFHMGAFKAAADAGVAVIPVAIRGTRSILHADSWFPHHGAVTVTVGEALNPAEVAKEEGTDRSWALSLALRKRARDFILLHCGEADLTVQG